MITYVESSLFESPAQTLVNTINIVGVMGRGIAKEFKDLYPDMYRVYVRRCRDKELHPGVLEVYRTSNKWVLNFPTKRHFKPPSKLEDVEAGLKTFVETAEAAGITSISFPQLGCGTGGLDWDRQVRPMMEHYLAPLQIEIFFHVFRGRVSESRPFDQLASMLQAPPEPLSLAGFDADLSRIAARRSVPVPSPDLVRAVHEQLIGAGIAISSNFDLGEEDAVRTALGLAADLPYVLQTRAHKFAQHRAGDGTLRGGIDAAWASAIQLDGSVARFSPQQGSTYPQEEILWISRPTQTSFFPD
jgi:O-acetyl-ADP-ribose deacetylase (regulator of RNase III)